MTHKHCHYDPWWYIVFLLCIYTGEEQSLISAPEFLMSKNKNASVFVIKLW